MKLDPRLGLWYTTSTRCKSLEKLAIIAPPHYDLKSPLFKSFLHHTWDMFLPPALTQCEERERTGSPSAPVCSHTMWLFVAPDSVLTVWPQDTSRSIKEEHIPGKEFKDRWFQKISAIVYAVSCAACSWHCLCFCANDILMTMLWIVSH